MKDSTLKRIAKGKGSPLIGKKPAPIDYEKSSRKVLVIKPVKICTNEELEELQKIKEKNGIIILPHWCEYEFGEIDSILVKINKNNA